MKILLIEDDAFVLKTIARTLRNHDFEVDTAMSLQEAAALLNSGSEPPDLVLVDYGLPDGRGLDVFNNATVVAHKIPLLFMSGGGFDQSLQTAAASASARGAINFLFKPFAEDELIAKVRESVS